MLDGQKIPGKGVAVVSGDGPSHRYDVFVGPTRAQLDDSWMGVGRSKCDTSLHWKMKRYYTSINNESRKSAKCTEGQAEGIDHLVTVRRNLRRRGSKQREGDMPLQCEAPIRSQSGRTPISRTRNDTSITQQSCSHDPNITETMPICAAHRDLQTQVQQLPNPESYTVSASTVPSDSRPRPGLGPARRVGISGVELARRSGKRPPFLKMLERSRVKETEVRDITSTAVSEALANITAVEETSAGKFIDATVSDTDFATTFDSIPPPPAHSFILSNLSDIGRLLRFPEPFLPVTKGGGQDGDAPPVNLLVLVRNIGAVEQMHNWRARKSRTASLSCDITVQDRKGCMIKVVITGACARRWVDRSCDDTIYSSRRRSQILVDRSNKCHSSFDHTSSAFSKQDSLLPIRSGDVIALSDLRLSRKRQSASKDAKEAELAFSVFAAASDQHHSALELCWRSELIEAHDDLINFDPALTVFDARCRAIYELAQVWKSG